MTDAYSEPLHTDPPNPSPMPDTYMEAPGPQDLLFVVGVGKGQLRQAGLLGVDLAPEYEAGFLVFPSQVLAQHTR